MVVICRKLFDFLAFWCVCVSWP